MARMIAQILRELIAAGLQGESLVAAVERIEQAQPKALDATAERRRAKDRERYYLRRGPPNTPTPPKSTETTVIEEVSLSSSLLSYEKSTSNKEVSKKERAKKNQLPDSWQPKPAHYLKAPASFVNRKAEDMRNWARSKAIVRADWDATFHGFLRPKETLNGQHRKNLVEECNDLADEAREYERQAGISR